MSIHRALLVTAIALVTASAAFGQPATLKPAVPDAVLPLLTLDDLTRFAVDRNPRLMQAVFAVDAARGRAIQASLYPNPTIDFKFDELGDKTGPRGVNTLPLVTQEIVTGRKLSLSRAVADKQVDQATLSLAAQRAMLLAGVRAAYFDVIALQRRIDILTSLVKIADQSVGQTRKLLDAKQVSRLDLLQLEIEAEKLRTELEASEREWPAARKKLAAAAGTNDLPNSRFEDLLNQSLPGYELDTVQRFVLDVHPEVRSARIGVERAQFALRRAQVEPYPNVALSTGYVRQNQNKSSDFTIGFSMTLPVWNRNQGNVRAAQAEIGVAAQEVGKVELDLTERLATVYREYAAAMRREERYRTAILPRARETYDLSLKAYQGGQFEYLRVLEAQRALTQANLEAVRALGDAWKAASAISGLTLEEEWPVVASPVKAP